MSLTSSSTKCLNDHLENRATAFSSYLTGYPQYSDHADHLYPHSQSQFQSPSFSVSSSVPSSNTVNSSTAVHPPLPPSFLRDEHEPIRSLYPTSFLAPQSFLSVTAIGNQSSFRSVEWDCTDNASLSQSHSHSMPPSFLSNEKPVSTTGTATATSTVMSSYSPGKGSGMSMAILSLGAVNKERSADPRFVRMGIGMDDSEKVLSTAQSDTDRVVDKEHYTVNGAAAGTGAAAEADEHGDIEGGVSNSAKQLDAMSAPTLDSMNMKKDFIMDRYTLRQQSSGSSGLDECDESYSLPSSNVGLQCPFSLSSLCLPSLPAYVEPFSTFSSLCGFSVIYSLLISFFRVLCCDYTFNHQKCKFSCVYYDSNSCEALTFKVFFYEQQAQQQQAHHHSDCSFSRIWIEFQRRFGCAFTFQRIIRKFVHELRAKAVLDEHTRNGAVTSPGEFDNARLDTVRVSALSDSRSNDRHRDRSPRRTRKKTDEPLCLSSFSLGYTSHSPRSHSQRHSRSHSPRSSQMSRSNSPVSPQSRSPLQPVLQQEGILHDVHASANAHGRDAASSTCESRATAAVVTATTVLNGVASFASIASTASMPALSRLSSPSSSMVSPASPFSVPAHSPIPMPTPLTVSASSSLVLSSSTNSLQSGGALCTSPRLPFCPPLRLDDGTTEILLCMCDLASAADCWGALQAFTALTGCAADCVNAALLCSPKYCTRLSAAIDAAIHSGDGQLLRLVCLLLTRLSESAAFVPSALLSCALFDSILSVLDCACCLFSSSRALSKPMRRSFLLECKRLCARMLRNCVVCPWRRCQFKNKIFSSANRNTHTFSPGTHYSAVSMHTGNPTGNEAGSERRIALEKIIHRYEKNEDEVLKNEMQLMKNSLQMK